MTVKNGTASNATGEFCHAFQHLFEFTPTTRTQQGYGARQLIPHSSLWGDGATLHLEDDTLMVRLEASYTVLKENQKYRSLLSDVLQKRNIEMHSSNIGRDFVLVSSAGTEHPVHKVVLSAASPVFLGMFGSNLEECKTGRCEIPDIDDATLSGLVRYMYLGCVECVKENAKNLLVAADKYQVLGLKNHCEDMLMENLNMDNVVDLLLFAEQMSIAELKEAALRYMAADAGKTMAAAGMDNLFGSGETELITEVVTTMLKLPKN